MVISLGLDRDRVEPGSRGLGMAEAGTGGGLVEDLHDLVPRLPANCRLAPNAFSPAILPCLCAMVPSGRYG